MQILLAIAFRYYKAFYQYFTKKKEMITEQHTYQNNGNKLARHNDSTGLFKLVYIVSILLFIICPR